MAKSKYKGVYLNPKNGRYFYLTKLKQKDGSFKSVKSKSIYTSPLICYSDLQKLKSTFFYNNNNDNQEKARKNKEVTTINKKEQQNIVVNKFHLKFIVDDYIRAYELKNRESSTDSLRYIIGSHFYNYFTEKYSIKQMCKNDVLLDYKKHIISLPISISWKNRILSVYRSLVERAFYLGIVTQQEYGLVKINLEPLKEVNAKKQDLEEDNFYTVEEYNKFRSVIDDEQYLLAFDVLFYGGFRIGELLAITVGDVDFETSSIEINKQKNKKGSFSEVKNKNGYRKTLIKKDVFERLKKYILDNKLTSNRAVFNFSRTSLRRKNVEYQQKAGLKHIRIHGFRHSCCSYLLQVFINNNLPINFKYIADHLGDSIDVVQKVYMHLYQNESTKMLDLI